MTSDTNEDKLLMNPSDVCTLLGIKESTLRKYALILQDAGYHFYTNNKGQRAYYDQDVTVIRRFIEIKKSTDMTLEQSANAVMTWVEQSNMSLRVTPKNNDFSRYDSDIKQMKETIEQQNQLLQKLVKKLDEQQKYIDERDKRMEERDKLLMASIRQSQEERQALLQQTAARLEDEKKKGFFSRLFGK